MDDYYDNEIGDDYYDDDYDDDDYYDDDADLVQARVAQAMNGTFAMMKGYGRFGGTVNLYEHPDNDEFVVVAVDTDDGQRVEVCEVSTAWLHSPDIDAPPVWFPLLGELSEG